MPGKVYKDYLKGIVFTIPFFALFLFSLPGAVLSCSAKKVPKECGIGEALRNCSRNYIRPPLCTPPVALYRKIAKCFGAAFTNVTIPSEWQRATADEGFSKPRKMSGTATGKGRKDFHCTVHELFARTAGISLFILYSAKNTLFFPQIYVRI